MPNFPPPLRRVCILMFGMLHLLFLTVCILPRKWRDACFLGRLTNAYESVTTCLQDWAMFHTIPTVHHMDTYLLVEPPGRPAERTGMVLPGLREYPQPENARLYSWMTLVIHSSERSDQREPYMRRAAAELLATGRYSADAQVRLVADTYFTRSLKGVRVLREIAVLKPTAMGPFRLGDLAGRPSLPVP